MNNESFFFFFLTKGLTRPPLLFIMPGTLLGLPNRITQCSSTLDLNKTKKKNNKGKCAVKTLLLRRKLN